MRYERNSTLCNYQYKTTLQAGKKTRKETTNKLCTQPVTLIHEIKTILTTWNYS